MLRNPSRSPRYSDYFRGGNLRRSGLPSRGSDSSSWGNTDPPSVNKEKESLELAGLPNPTVERKERKKKGQEAPTKLTPTTATASQPSA